MEFTRSSLLWAREEDLEDLDALEEEFTFTPKYEDAEPLKVLKHYNGYVGFPRNSSMGEENLIIDHTTLGKPIPFEVEFIGEMFEYQETAILSFMENIKRKQFDLILSAQTGAGKTVMLIKMWTLVQVPLLVVVPKSDLVEQWIERIKKFTGLEEDQIGVARQDRCDYKGKPVVIGMLHSICKDKYPKAFKDYFGMVAFDELHKLGAKTFSQAGGLFPARYRLGATATLRRADGMSKVFYAHMGNTIIKAKKGDQPEPKIIVVKYNKSSGKIPSWARKKMQRRGLLFSLLCSNIERTDWIAYYSHEVYKTGRQLLVLGERIAQLRKIIELLTSDRYSVPKEEVGLYIGKTSATRREKIAKECKIIVATTSMLSLGTDIPTLRGLVFATPLADAEQAIGRICRFSLVKHSPVVIDLADMRHKDCFIWHRARLALYDRKGWEVVYAGTEQQ